MKDKKFHVCVVKQTHSNGFKTYLLEVDGRVNVPISKAGQAEEIINDLHLILQEAWGDERLLTELYY